MTNAEDAWDDLFRRAAQSRFAGVTAETDDLMGAVDLREGAINPGAGDKVPGAGAGGPGMMPPMMGATGGGGGGASSLAAGPGAAATGGGSEPVTATRGVAALQPLEAPTAASAGGDAAVGGPGGSGVTAGGGIGGGGDVGLPEPDPDGAVGSGDAPGPRADPAPGGVPETGGPRARGDFSVDPALLRRAAGRWYALSDLLRANGGLGAPDDYGLLRTTPVPGLAAEATAWARGAGAEFRAVGDALAKLADSYLANEETGAGLAGRALTDGEV